MISLEFNFSEFIDAVKDRDRHVILSLAESEARQAEKNAEIKGYGQNYVDALTGFIYLLRYEQKPYKINEEHFQMFRIVCEKLVSKKQILSDMMNMFDCHE